MVAEKNGEPLDVDGLDFVGGRLCLDFANTTSMRASAVPRERLHGYEDVVRWCLRAELFGGTEAARLFAMARDNPAEAERAWRRALELREAIFALASAAGRGEPPPPAELERLNAVLSEGMGRRRLRSAECGLTWTWAEAADGMEWMLWPIAYSAAELLSSGDVERVKVCGGDSCDWLFLDASRNGTRRWCVMQDCGNRAKARRHYHRSKETGREPAGQQPVAEN